MIVLHDDKNTHYFYVMAWDDVDKTNQPKKKKKFDIYDDAVSFYEKLCNKYALVILFEHIGGKRKSIMNSTDNDTQKSYK